VSRADTLANQAYQQIRLALLQGSLSQDQFYSENYVAQLLAISRTPAREALRQLETEGLIEVLPQRGFRVRRMSRPELVEFFELREMLESYVVRRLCQTIEDRDVRSLRHILDRQQQAAEDIAEFITLDEEFHLSMARMAGLQRTERIVASLRGVLWLMGRRVVNDLSRWGDVVNEHEAILAGLQSGDPQTAAAAVSGHINATAEMALARAQVADGALVESGPRQT
jgi:DNA-binding GntR family transcriptional regulator